MVSTTHRWREMDGLGRGARRVRYFLSPSGIYGQRDDAASKAGAAWSGSARSAAIATRQREATSAAARTSMYADGSGDGSRAGEIEPHTASRGTDSSNPFPSSGQSVSHGK